MVIEECARAISYLQQRIGNRTGQQLGLLYLLRELGWNVPIDTDLSGVKLSVLSKIALIDEALCSSSVDYVGLAKATKDAIGSFKDIPRELKLSLGTEFEKKLPRQMLDYVVTEYLEYQHPKVFSLFVVLGIFQIGVKRPESSFQIISTERSIDWSLLGNRVGGFENIPNHLYGWGGSKFDSYKLLENVERLVKELGIPAGHFNADSLVQARLNTEGPALDIPLVERSSCYIGLEIYPLLPDAGQENAGLGVAPYLIGSGAEEIAIDESLTLDIESSITLDKTSGFTLRPNTGVCFYALNDASVTEGNFSARLIIQPADDKLFRADLFPAHLEVSGMGVELTAHLKNGDSDFGIEINLVGGVLVIQAGEGDGFLQKILPEKGIQSNFDLGIGCTRLGGLYFRGSGGIEVTIPVHGSIGPLTMDSVYLAISLKEKITLVLAASFTAKIGPVGVSIERMGIEIPFSFPEDSSGNLGPVNIEKPGYLPPRGAGLVVKTSSVTGGGFVEFDRDNKRYAGILQLAFKKFALTAVGLIETRMPDDSKGFSMLIIICVEFKPGIALGYGFFLDGAGGIVATHRTMLVDVLRDGLKTGTADAVLFPENPILNAPRIISDLRSVFPPSEGHFIIGPIALISFMQLARFEIGIMIELPGPSRIVLVGQNSLKLPNATNPRLEIHEDILGVIDFDRKTLSYDATIYNSHFLKFTLTGDSALRLVLSENKSFAAAAGGLNPRFDPPPGFPTLRRLCLSLGNGDNPRINLETYVAITSNSAQHGSRVEIYASKGKFGIKGHMGYDVLLVFSPFSFIADMNAGVSVSAFGETICSADLDLTLSGPSPWKATGKATFEFFRMKKSVHVSATWGDEEPASLEAVDPTYQLIEELKKPISLAGILPGDRDISVSLRPPANPQSNEITVHPEGKLEVRQRVLPLQIELAKFGGAPIIGTNFFDVVARSDRTDAPEKDIQDEPLMDDFARGQFEELSDSEKLSCPSYEKFKAGILIGSDGITCEHAVPCMLEYETQVIDENGISQPHGFQRLPWRYGARLVTGSAARLGNKRNSGSNRYANPGATPIVRTKEEGYVVVWTKDLTRFNEINGNNGSMTFTNAKQELTKYLRENPGARGRLEVVRTHEAQSERAAA